MAPSVEDETIIPERPRRKQKSRPEAHHSKSLSKLPARSKPIRHVSIDLGSASPSDEEEEEEDETVLVSRSSLDYLVDRVHFLDKEAKSAAKRIAKLEAVVKKMAAGGGGSKKGDDNKEGGGGEGSGEKEDPNEPLDPVTESLLRIELDKLIQTTSIKSYLEKAETLMDRLKLPMQWRVVEILRGLKPHVRMAVVTNQTQVDANNWDEWKNHVLHIAQRLEAFEIWKQHESSKWSAMGGKQGWADRAGAY
ncbi:hypothetical protein MMC25_005607 [Agyrium rufum]|nr:hypothetical protein [Agyrium rufum]